MNDDIGKVVQIIDEDNTYVGLTGTVKQLVNKMVWVELHALPHVTAIVRTEDLMVLEGNQLCD